MTDTPTMRERLARALDDAGRPGHDISTGRSRCAEVSCGDGQSHPRRGLGMPSDNSPMWQRLLHAIDHDAFGKGSALPGAGQRRRKAKAQLEAILAELARPSDEMLAASGCECGADDAEAMRHRRDDFAAVIRAVGAKRGARDGA